MAGMSQRDMTQLRREDLLDDYWKISKRRKGALVATALRTRSMSMRDILVHGAVKNASSSAELKQLVFSGSLTSEDIKSIEGFADLGRLILLQDIHEDDKIFGEKVLKFALACSSGQKLSRKNSLALIQHLISSGNAHEAQEVLELHRGIDSDYFNYLEAELNNPFTLGNEDTSERWLKQFNRMFVDNDLAPILIEGDADSAPFDRLKSVPDAENIMNEAAARPLVTVVLTAYRPDETSLRTSVRSILNQTWENLELIIVNDASGPEFESIFARIQDLDARIQIVHSATNQGTYVSRNIGFALARGEFITGQDDDDWSHPERIARQIQYLDDNPNAIGCRVTAVRCDEVLSRVRPGYSPLGENASSLMIRREGYEAAGDYLEARKAADTEYYFRVMEVTGRPMGRVWAPLTIIRILSDSLSRGDFSPGWKHSARRSFRSSYEFWHRTKAPHEMKIRGGTQPFVKVPRRFLAPNATVPSSKLDVVFAGNWEKLGGPQKSMLEEIEALVDAGYRVGVMNLEAARFMTNDIQVPLNPHIQGLINDGYVDEVLYDDPVHVRLLILRYPPILQFFTADTTGLEVDSMVILANQAPSEQDGQDIRYLVHDCHANARNAFGVEPVWVPQGPQVRRSLEHYLTSPVLSEVDFPGILNIDSWWHDRRWHRSLTPVVGRHSRDDSMKWPEDESTLRELYRVDGSYDVRIMGGVKSPLKVLKMGQALTGWTVYEANEIAVKNFLHSLDYFVYYQHSEAIEAFGRAILEALASGVVVILPKKFSEVFGDAALYANPGDVGTVIQALHSDFSEYKKQIDKAYTVLDTYFSYRSYVNKIEGLLNALVEQEER